ncbi:MAG: polyphosphate polymerase domain-containing protein [Paracoccaceae bacterium]
MEALIAECLTSFQTISLVGLNGKAAMLERLDNKYIVPARLLLPAFRDFAALFDVLEIEGRRAFIYATRYFDDEERHAYYDHHQGRRKRSKIRVRNYVDAGFSYLEVKLKDLRGSTAKKRLRVENGLEELDGRCLAFIEDCHRKQYGRGLNRPLRPVIAMEYERITLVAREGGERMTIDTRMGFHSGGKSLAVADDMFIIETKSARGNGIADKIMRARHLKPTNRCSKYCVAMAALGEVRRHNHFLPALKRLKLIHDPNELFVAVR